MITGLINTLYMNNLVVLESRYDFKSLCTPWKHLLAAERTHFFNVYTHIAFTINLSVQV